MPRLKEVREGHGWSQKKLAEESGVSRDSISNYETGQRDAWPATAKKLADALVVEIADLRAPTLEPALPKDEAPTGTGQLEEEPVMYTTYEALGHLLAQDWRDDLDEWNEKLPARAEDIDSLEAWGMVIWLREVGDTKHAYVYMAREAGIADRAEFQRTLALMEQPYEEGLEKAGRIFSRIKTDVEFHRIIRGSEGLGELRKELQPDG